MVIKKEVNAEAETNGRRTEMKASSFSCFVVREEIMCQPDDESDVAFKRTLLRIMNRDTHEAKTGTLHLNSGYV